MNLYYNKKQPILPKVVSYLSAIADKQHAVAAGCFVIATYNLLFAVAKEQRLPPSLQNACTFCKLNYVIIKNNRYGYRRHFKNNF